MANEGGQERTEQATPKRLREAREKGQVPRSRELNSMALLMAAAGGMLTLGADMLSGLSDVLRSGLTLQRAQIFNSNSMIPTLGNTMQESFIVLAPFFILLVVVAAVSPISLGGWSFSTKAISFKWERLDPIKGLFRCDGDRDGRLKLWCVARRLRITRRSLLARRSRFIVKG